MGTFGERVERASAGVPSANKRLFPGCERNLAHDSRGTPPIDPPGGGSTAGSIAVDHEGCRTSLVIGNSFVVAGRRFCVVARNILEENECSGVLYSGWCDTERGRDCDMGGVSLFFLKKICERIIERIEFLSDTSPT